MNNELTIPESWVTPKLGVVCFTTSGGTPSRKIGKYFEGTIPWVKSGELENNVILDTEEKITQEAIKNSSAKIFPKGTLLIALYGATVGKLAFLGVEAATNQAVCGIYKSEALNSKFLYYYLFSQRNNLVSQSFGGAQPNISQTILKELPIPFPPLAEQHRIVAKIDELFSSLDKGIESLKTAQQQLKVYRQAVLKYAFEGKLTNKNVNGELPKDWVWKQLKEITSVLGDGLHGTPKYSEAGEYYFINGNNLSGKSIIIKDNTKRVSIEEYEKYKKPLNDHTIFVSINGTLGNTGFYNNENVILGKSACYFNVLNSIDKYYVRYCITSQRFINYAHKYATGSTIKNVGLKAMREFEIPIPPTIEEQHNIVKEIESRLSICDKIEESIIQGLLQAEALRQSILKKAFEGKLVPQDPNDEPASKLLERIKAEKEKLAPNIKNKSRSTKTKRYDE